MIQKDPQWNVKFAGIVKPVRIIEDTITNPTIWLLEGSPIDCTFMSEHWLFKRLQDTAHSLSGERLLLKHFPRLELSQRFKADLVLYLQGRGRQRGYRVMEIFFHLCRVHLRGQ